MLSKKGSKAANPRFDDMSLPRGLRNNNPFNLALTDTSWKGKVPVADNTDLSFEQFYELPSGLVAGMQNIRNLYKKGFNTINKLVDVYTASEDDRNSYKQALVNGSTIAINEVIPLNSQKELLLFDNIIKFENGGKTVDAEMLKKYFYTF